MPGSFFKDDPRVQKTIKALMDAMSGLLERRKFTQITVHGLCGEALISKATFYSHYADKYDLLKQWLIYIKPEILNNTKRDFENVIAVSADRNKKIISNLLEDATEETAGLLCHFMLSLLDISTDETDGGQTNPRYLVVSKFCCGGLMNYLKWQARNKSIKDLDTMNAHLYSLILVLLKWYAESE